MGEGYGADAEIDGSVRSAETHGRGDGAGPGRGQFGRGAV